MVLGNQVDIEWNRAEGVNVFWCSFVCWLITHIKMNKLSEIISEGLLTLPHRLTHSLNSHAYIWKMVEVFHINDY